MTGGRAATVYVVAPRGRSAGAAAAAKGVRQRAASQLGGHGGATLVVTDANSVLHAPAVSRSARVAFLDRVTPAQLDILRERFSRVLAEYEGMQRLPDAQLLEVLEAPNASELFVAGAIDRALGSLMLYRGNLERLVVPLESFAASGGVRPDFGRLAIGEYGHSVRLGEYEAAADAILYEHDPIYRRAAKKRVLAAQDGLGASIRRLRLQRGLSRADFPGLSEKQVARIERGDTARPRTSTLRRFAERLGVEVEELGSY